VVDYNGGLSLGFRVLVVDYNGGLSLWFMGMVYSDIAAV